MLLFSVFIIIFDFYSQYLFTVTTADHMQQLKIQYK